MNMRHGLCTFLYFKIPTKNHPHHKIYACEIRTRDNDNALWINVRVCGRVPCHERAHPLRTHASAIIIINDLSRACDNNDDDVSSWSFSANFRLSPTNGPAAPQTATYRNAALACTICKECRVHAMLPLHTRATRAHF